MAWKQASNSLSKAEYLTWVLSSFLEKKPERLPRVRRPPPLLLGAADVVSRGIHHETELETLGRMRQACGRGQGVLGRHEGGSLRIDQADRFCTLWAADEQVGERLKGPRRRWEESAVEIYSA
jgi:hypothetical protein